MTYSLINGVRENQQYPATFHVPPPHEREKLQVGFLVKLLFVEEEEADRMAERMWVEVTKVLHNPLRYVGTLLNSPVTLESVGHGDSVEFRPEHVISTTVKDFPDG